MNSEEILVKTSYLIIGIIFIFLIIEDKKLRSFLLGFFTLAYLDGIFCEGYFTRTYFLVPLVETSELVQDLTFSLFIATSDIINALVNLAFIPIVSFTIYFLLIVCFIIKSWYYSIPQTSEEENADIPITFETEINKASPITFEELVAAHDIYLPNNPAFEADLKAVMNHFKMLEEEEE